MLEIKHFVREIKQVTSIRRISFTVRHLKARGYPHFEIEILEKYQKLKDDLKDYPEWLEKVEHEVEPKLKLLADQILKLPGTEVNTPFKDFNFHKYFR